MQFNSPLITSLVQNIWNQLTVLTSHSEKVLKSNRIEGANDLLVIFGELRNAELNEVSLFRLYSASKNLVKLLKYVLGASHTHRIITPEIFRSTQNLAQQLLQQATTLLDEIHKISEGSVELSDDYPEIVGVGPSPDIVLTLNQFRERLSADEGALTTLQTRIEGIPDQISASLDLTMRTIDKPFSTAQVKIDESLAELQRVKTAAETEIDRVKTELAMSFSKTAGIVLASDYGENALDEKRQADSFRNYAASLMVVSILLASWLYFETFGAAYNWQSSISRLVIILLLSVPATYFARESSRHRYQYHTQLRMALDLHAINPYLASLPAESQHKLKGEIALRLFGSRELVTSTDIVDNKVSDALAAVITKLSANKS